MASRLLIGAMSGTSADGVDVALVRFDGIGIEAKPTLLAKGYRAYPKPLKELIFKLRSGDRFDWPMLAGAGREISLNYAIAVRELMAAQRIDARQIAAIAAHGQTMYHAPPATVQWLDPALLAYETGCAVISDFRRADCAAGGQGAPLVPYADFLLFRSHEHDRVLLNLGGIANLTYLPVGVTMDRLIAFDAGPANCVIDHLCRRHDPSGPGFDAGGALAGSGVVCDRALQRLMQSACFQSPPPKSTDGPEMLGLWDAVMTAECSSYPDQLATACAWSASSIAHGIGQIAPTIPDELIVSGGGVENAMLMRQIRMRVTDSRLLRTDDLGVPSEAKEAMAFAILGAAHLDGIPANVPSVTGAKRAVVLGSLRPAP